MRIAALLILLTGCASRGVTPQSVALPQTQPAAAEDRGTRVRQAIGRGVEFIVKSQQRDGSWGTGQLTDGFLWLSSSVPGSFDGFRSATTALCVMALREAGEKTAHDRGVEYLVAHGEARRAEPDLIYNIWAHMYVVQALCGEMKTNQDPRLAAAVAWHIDRLVRYEDMRGGWNYYDFEVGSQTPAGTPVSFGTAAGLVALWEARQAGVEVPQKLVDRAIRCLERMRLPNGAYIYGEYLQYAPRALANQPRGAVGRVQPCNYALWLCNSKKVGPAECLQGLEMFEREHPFLEMGRKRPFPHSSWYQTAPYYFYFDHYYAARLLEKFGGDTKGKYAPMIADWILPLQESDGSWWDFAMWDYHKPYGTAFVVMTLLRCQ
jgi:hypothetical protein